MDDLRYTEVSGPAIDKLDALKDSQGQPPSSGDLTYDRILAVARALARVTEVQRYLLERVVLTADMPHRDYVSLYKMQQELQSAKQTLDVFFFGD